MKKVVIIGSGPAGISSSLYLTRSGIENCIISNNQSSLNKATKIENYYGMTSVISGKELYENGLNQIKNIGGKIIYDEIVGIDYDEDFIINGVKEDYHASIIIIATGASKLMPNIKGLKEEKGVSFCALCDAFFYKGKKVCVIGSGNYSIHEARILSKVADVTIVSQSKIDGLEENIHQINERLLEVKSEDNKHILVFENSEEVFDGVFIATGVASGLSFAKKMGLKIENNKIVVDQNMMTNMPNVYAIGDVTMGVSQIAKAVYQGMVASLDIINRNKDYYDRKNNGNENP